MFILVISTWQPTASSSEMRCITQLFRRMLHRISQKLHQTRYSAGAIAGVITGLSRTVPKAMMLSRHIIISRWIPIGRTTVSFRRAGGRWTGRQRRRVIGVC